MITEREISVEQKLKVYGCSKCDLSTSSREAAATHYAMNHLPRRALAAKTTPAGDGWFVAHTVWCANIEEHRMLAEWRGRSPAGWVGPTWYATVWRVRRDSECGEVTEYRVEPVETLMKEAAERLAEARAILASMRRLAAAGAP